MEAEVSCKHCGITLRVTNNTCVETNSNIVQNCVLFVGVSMALSNVALLLFRWRLDHNCGYLLDNEMLMFPPIQVFVIIKQCLHSSDQLEL